MVEKVVTLPFHSSRAGVYFPTSSIWTGPVAYSGQETVEGMGVGVGSGLAAPLHWNTAQDCHVRRRALGENWGDLSQQQHRLTDVAYKPFWTFQSNQSSNRLNGMNEHSEPSKISREPPSQPTESGKRTHGSFKALSFTVLCSFFIF